MSAPFNSVFLALLFCLLSFSLTTSLFADSAIANKWQKTKANETGPFLGRSYGQRGATPVTRTFIAITTGLYGPRMGHRGIVMQVLGGKRLLLVGNYHLPHQGSTIVVSGPWSYDRKYREGVIWGGMWQYFIWPKVDELAVVFDDETGEYDKDLLAEGDGFRRKLLAGGDFQLGRRSSLSGFTPFEIPLDVHIEVYEYRRLVSKGQVNAARIHLERFYRRERLRRRSSSMGRGPISNMGFRDFASWSGGVRVEMLTTDVPHSQATAWFVHKDKLFLFIGTSGPLVHDVAAGFLAHYLAQPDQDLH